MDDASGSIIVEKSRLDLVVPVPLVPDLLPGNRKLSAGVAATSLKQDRCLDLDGSAAQPVEA